MKRRLRFQIPAEFHGSTLVEFLSRRFPYHTPEDWAGKAAEGLVHVNESPAPSDCTLRTGDLVEHLAQDVPEPPTPMNVSVVFEDHELLVIDKPAGLPTHPGGRYFHKTLWAVLKARHGLESPSFVNRLDRETSGLVLVAKTEAAARKCRAQFAGRHVEKRYLAVVEGLFPAQVDAVGFLVQDPAVPGLNKRLFVLAETGVSAPPEGETAETVFRLVRPCRELSLVEAVPHTGRQHQIRATLLALGHPLVGDKLYGPDPGIFVRFCKDLLTDEDRRWLRMGRQALHASSLRLRHPSTGRDMTFEAPLPADIAGLLA